MLSADTLMVRSPRPFTAPAEDQLVMLDAEQSRYFGLDAVGRRIWELLEHPMTVDDLCARLTTEFDVSREECERDVQAFLQQLLDANLLDLK